MPAVARGLAAVLACAIAALSAGCGGSSRIGEDLPRQDARLMLDTPPRAMHAGIALAAERGFDRGEGVRLRLRRPGRAGALPALRRGEVQAAVVPIEALAEMRARGFDAVGVMAVVQRPVLSVFTDTGVRSARDLAGRRVAVGDEPAAEGVLRTIVRDDGGDFDALSLARPSDPAQALAARRVDAAVLDRFGDGVALRAAEPGLRELQPEEHGVPPHPGLVVVVERATLDEDASVVRALIRALQRGYREAQIDPESAITALHARGARADRATLMAQLDAVAPSWTAGAGVYGRLRPPVLREWARWASAAGILDERLEVQRAFATDLVSRQANP